MGHFQYETFEMVPSAGGGLSNLRSTILKRELDEAYARGFKDGVNVTKKAVDVERNAQLASISECLEGLKLTHDDACIDVIQTIGPLLQAILRQIAPTIAKSAWSKTLCAHVTEIAQDAAQGQVQIIVPQAQVASIAGEFSTLPHEVDVLSSDTLSAFCAECRWGHGEDDFNLDDKINAINAIVSEFLDQHQETQK